MGQCASRRSATPGSEPLAVRRSASERLGWIAAAREQRSRFYILRSVKVFDEMLEG
ncbi:hypothetical protein HPP92_020622 [Vanilla planifolia]|uniref:Uncharacterized protein n=1 Tax=Vanilla planifolia TaxID=51239 RepID=A0A835UJY6_VANPL|nr:hypothetical protein HPP92_020622 [Vanilla planifolia]